MASTAECKLLPRFHGHRKVIRIDFNDLVHGGSNQDDPAFDRDGSSAKTRPAAPSCHRDIFLCGKLKDFLGTEFLYEFGNEVFFMSFAILSGI
jgi:hypothetical protein